jgi:hydroxymethylglutaryl-CoA synthase
MRGIVSYGAYIPYFRLDRAAIAGALGTPPGRGTRAVASYDEDTTSLGAEAARQALRGRDERVEALYFATSDPAYLEKTNAATIHAAAGLDHAALALDMGGAVRSGIGALRAAATGTGPALAVVSDIRTGLPGGADERDGGDGAAAFLFADGAADTVLAELVGQAHATDEFLDRWRVPGDATVHQWEERFGESIYVPLAEQALTDALKSAGITAGDVDHLVVTGLSPRAAKRVLAASGVRPESLVNDLSAAVGNTGAAHLGILLADALDRAQPDQVIVTVLLADGASVFVFRTGQAIAHERPNATVADQVAAGRTDLPYTRFLGWRGQLHREPPRRPNPTPPAAPPAYRREAWKFRFSGSTCESCGTRHLPPTRVCIECGAVDRMATERLADTPATIATFTADRLAYSQSPPLMMVVIDFDGGGRYRCELTDCDPDAVAIGDRVEMTFRRTMTADGVHNYAWKARPIRTAGGEN